MNDQLIQTQAECYRLYKMNQELTDILQKAMVKVGATNVDEFISALPEKKDDPITE